MPRHVFPKVAEARVEDSLGSEELVQCRRGESDAGALDVSQGALVGDGRLEEFVKFLAHDFLALGRQVGGGGPEEEYVFLGVVLLPNLCVVKHGEGRGQV